MKRLLNNFIGKICCKKIYHQTKKINISNEIVSKQYWDLDVFNRELEILNYLNSQVDFVPKVINIDYKNLIIRISYCGVSLLNTNYLPSNWKQQIDSISSQMKNLKIFHNDLKLSNLTLYNSKIYLIDFGHATFDNPKKNLNCFKKSKNNYDKLKTKIERKELTKKKSYSTFVDLLDEELSI